MSVFSSNKSANSVIEQYRTADVDVVLDDITLITVLYSILIMKSLKFRRFIYTLNHKKRDILFLTITLANLRRFL